MFQPPAELQIVWYRFLL